MVLSERGAHDHAALGIRPGSHVQWTAANAGTEVTGAECFVTTDNGAPR